MLEYLTDPLFWIIFGWVFLPAVLCYIMAIKKRRSTFFWLLAGIFLGWIGVLILYFLPKLTHNYKVEKTDRMDAKLKMYRELEEMKQAKLKSQNENVNES